MDSPNSLNPLSKILVRAFEEEEKRIVHRGGAKVNPIIAEIASWYEKLRNVMEYRDDEVILRAAIERILKRRLILGGSGETIAPQLLRELAWARYFPDGSIPEHLIEQVSHKINLYLKLREQVVSIHKIRESEMTMWMYQLMSSDIEQIVKPEKDKEAMVNFMFHILRENVKIADDTESTRDAQVFIAIRRSYAKNDIALLRYHLFLQFFGELTHASFEKTVSDFAKGKIEIDKQLAYPLRFKIFSYIKRQTPPFLILDDVLRANRKELSVFVEDKERLTNAILETCQKHYSAIAAKVRRAIIRSVIFILLSKSFFAFAVEGTYENYFYGEVQWLNIATTIAIPPILMILVGLTIKTPDKKNTERILTRINTVLFNSEPIVGGLLTARHIRKKTTSIMDIVLNTLWLAAFISSFGLVVFILTKLNFNIISQGVFIFFLAMVTFLSYRIRRTAQVYTISEKQGLLTPIVDFLFLPIAQVGRFLTEGISQINILLLVLDFVIEAPFKAIFGFVEQLFIYLHAKREYLE